MSLKSILKDVFSSVKPYKINTGIGEGISEIAAVGYDYVNSSVFHVTAKKRTLFQEYKEMAMFPEVADAIDEIVFEAINPDKDGEFIGLTINDANLSDNENIVDNLQKEFDYILDRVLDFNTNADDLFRKFYVEGELFAELMIDPEKNKKGVMGIQILPSYSMTVEYDDKQNPIEFIQDLSQISMAFNSQQVNTSVSGENSQINFKPSQIIYVNSGIIDYHRKLVYSYLERAKISYRQLKWMENALLIYRITRAPERRVFYIDVGKLPKSKADQYITSLINRYKNRKVYNPTTGEVDVGKDVISMTEDFYFPSRSDGTGSRVDVLPGGQNLGELTDVEYFQKKLFKALKIPETRMDKTSMYDKGSGQGTITREEIKFSKYVNRIRARFLDFVTQVYLTHLQLKGLYGQYNLSKSKISITFNETNEWKELKALEMLSERINIFGQMAEWEHIFPIEWLYKNVMNFTDSEIQDIQDLLKKQPPPVDDEGGGGGGGGRGDFDAALAPADDSSVEFGDEAGGEGGDEKPEEDNEKIPNARLLMSRGKGKVFS